MVSHLQKDLQTEKQDKQHIQKELNDALTILNKPTQEMGTQTDLTAEQISQMEKDLEYQRKLLREGADEIGKLEQEISQKEGEINQLKEQTKDLGEPNETEKKLMEYEQHVLYSSSSYDDNVKLVELRTGKTPDKSEIELNYEAITK